MREIAFGRGLTAAFIASSLFLGAASASYGKDLSTEAFSAQEFSLLAPLLELPVEPDALQAERAMAKWPKDLRAKLVAHAGGFLTEPSPNLATFMKTAGLNKNGLLKLRADFVDAVASSVIERLVRHDKSELRLMSRDMNDIYLRVVSLLYSSDRYKAFSEETKKSVLARVNLANLSRPLARSLRSEQDLRWILQLSENQIRQADKIWLLDLGYLGTLPNVVANLPLPAELKGKLAWNFIWKAPSAPDQVSTWPLDSFFAQVERRYPALSDATLMGGVKQSFRADVIEHSPKWYDRIEQLQSGPTIVLLDVDETLLKEVPIADFGAVAATQRVRYQPSASVVERYRKRLANPGHPKNEGKVVHYEFTGNGNEISSAVSVRPGIANLLRELRPLREAGRVRIFLASSNDESRTRAVHEQIQLDGRSFKAWGVEMMPNSQFEIPGNPGSKDLNQALVSLKLPPTTPIFMIDNYSEHVVRAQAGSVQVVSEWDSNRAKEQLLEGKSAAANRLSDIFEFRQIARAIYQSSFMVRTSDPVMHFDAFIKAIADLENLSGAPAVPVQPAPEPKSYQEWLDGGLKGLLERLPANSVADPSAYISANGVAVLALYVQARSAIQSQSVDARENSRLPIVVIAAMDILVRKGQISERDYRRIMARLFSDVAPDDVFWKGVTEKLSGSDLFVRTLTERHGFFTTTKKKGTERTSATYKKVIEVLGIKPDCTAKLLKGDK